MKVNPDELFLKSLIYNKLHLNEEMFMENYVAQVLLTKCYDDLFFYEKRDKETHKSIRKIHFLYSE